ncbi:MAG TPA: right-handed parallel beta-helix repeat-containing protein [Candidatus Saccharimonadales bacterium]|nr:right-handed parallel beta-helix repeat-containing protein [Candidatus Saccharimonadales bacterium]
MGKIFGKIGKTFGWLACILGLPVTVLAIPSGPAPGLVIAKLKAGATAADIQKEFDHFTNGCEVILPPGKFSINRPIVLQYNYQTLRGAGPTTILFLVSNANCPVIIMGEPVNRPMRTVRHLSVCDLFIDGNRTHQQRELWRESGQGSEIRNNGITVQNVSDSSIENVTCTRCRSGGLVTTLGVRRLTVNNFGSFDNEFDGLACYLTTDSVFSNLYLHNNPGAGISLDLAFDHNVIRSATLASNDLGIFMRDSRDNKFDDVSIRHNHDFGVFMAQAFEDADHVVRPQPDTECANNSFTNLVGLQNGRAHFRVNDISCTNNVIIGAIFDGSVRALSTPEPDLVTVK